MPTFPEVSLLGRGQHRLEKQLGGRLTAADHERPGFDLLADRVGLKFKLTTFIDTGRILPVGLCKVLKAFMRRFT